jgi:ABC-type nitrate/sulfonate/bicarbonate transport system ATPase subunit
MTSYIKKEVLLKATDVQLRLGNRVILRNINFEIKNIVRPGMQQGQIVSLVGRSGAGKTQLFKLMSGLQQPSAGSITLRNAAAVKAGDMGVIFQHYYLFEWRTVYQSLMMAARQNPLLEGKEKEQIAAFANRFQLTDQLSLYPQQLSGGQRQRASIIQQLLKGADFLLLDEPFSGLDICVLDKVVELLLEVSLSDEFKTLIIVSHDIPTAVSVSDTIFILGADGGEQGSTIKKEIDLVERGLAWQENIRHCPGFMNTVEEIRANL